MIWNGGGWWASVAAAVALLLLSGCAPAEPTPPPMILKPHLVAVRVLSDSGEELQATRFTEPERFEERCIDDGRMDLCVWFGAGTYELLIRNSSSSELVIDWIRGRFVGNGDDADLAACSRPARRPSEAPRGGEHLSPGASVMTSVVPDRGSGCDTMQRDAFGYPDRRETAGVGEGAVVALELPFEQDGERGHYRLEFVLIERPMY